MQRCLWIGVLIVLGTCALAAQEKKAAQPQTVTSVMDHRLAQAEKEFVGAAEAMPEEKFSFAPTNGEFKGVRNFGQQVKHVAAVNYQFAAAMLEEKPPASATSEEGPAEVKSKTEIIKFLKDSFEYTHKAYAAMTHNNAVAPIKNPFGEGSSLTRLGLATLEIGHIFDHYGQMVEYLRMNGIVPPASRQ